MRTLFVTGAAVAIAGLALVTSAATATATADSPPSRGDAPVVRAEPVAHGPAIASTSVLRASGIAAPLTVTSAGQVVTFVFTVSNAGGRPVTDPSLTGTLRGAVVPIACPAGTLAAGGTVTCSGSYRVLEADLGTGSLSLSASVDATSVDGRAVGAGDVLATAVVQQRGVRAPVTPVAAAVAMPDPSRAAAAVAERDVVAGPAGAAHRKLGAAPATPSATPSGGATTWSSGPVAYTGPPNTGVSVATGLALLLAGGLLLVLARPRRAHHARSTVGRWRH